jgi:hypothetical protein
MPRLPGSASSMATSAKDIAEAAVCMSAICVPTAWYIWCMKKPLTVTEYTSMGGNGTMPFGFAD